MIFQPRFDIYALFMLVGISQGIFLVYFYLSRAIKGNQTQLFRGLFMLVVVVICSEILLNYSGLIVKVIHIENYSEPFVFLLMPLFYMIVRTHLGEFYRKEDFVHFFPFIIYSLYCTLYFAQSPEFKYNSYVYCYQPGWEYLNVQIRIPEDPLGLRGALAPLYIGQFIVYLYLIPYRLIAYPANIPFRFLGRKDPVVRPLFWLWLHAILITMLITWIKVHFERDLGDYIIGSYLSLLLYIAGFFVLSQGIAGPKDGKQHAAGRPRYEKSPLTEQMKTAILENVQKAMQEDRLYAKNALSLKDLAKHIGQPQHYVSQVINEKLQKSFFDLIAFYRVEDARKLLRSEGGRSVTIEDIAGQVGYNSKAAFNKAFKQVTGLTPSAWRDIGETS